MLPAQPAILAVWILTTVAIGWWVALTLEDRQQVRIIVHRLLYWRGRAELAQTLCTPTEKLL